jgi:hypothetical protein
MNVGLRRGLLPLAVALACVGPLLAEESLRDREAHLLAQVKAEGAGNAEHLRELASVREALGEYQQARDTYGLLKRLHATERLEGEWVPPTATYGRLADFWMVRLQRQINLGPNPPGPDAALRRQLGPAAYHAAWDNPRPGSMWMVELAVRVDLDADRVDELFVVGGTALPAREHEPIMYIAKWNGTAYVPVWRATSADIKPWPYGYEMLDMDGDGWTEIRLGFSNEPSDDTGFLRFNGQDVLNW